MAEFLLVGAGVQVIKAQLFRPNEFDIEESDIKSLFGTPVFDEVIIAGGNFVDINKPDKPVVAFDGLTLQTVLLEVSQTKNIITTSLQGRNGTVKEYVSDGDFTISMTGGIIGEVDADGQIQNINNFYPIVDVGKLSTILKVPDALTITSEFLQLFGINEVVVTDYTINQPEATRNIQPFNVSMLSDVPIQLNELENE